ncbi:MAG: hypothetical protein JNL82_17455 [Myxococcales bacterium]|nr:hypothetical protein [Myxococcales bacterium]
MTIQKFRVVRVLAGHSPVARLDGVDDDDGLEIRLEVSAEVARTVSPGQVLVVEWSLQGAVSPDPKPEPRTLAAPTRTGPVVIVDAEFTTSAPRPANTTPPRTTSGSIDPAAVDREFMALLANKPGAREVTSRDIDHELNTLLGAAGAKGQK